MMVSGWALAISRNGPPMSPSLALARTESDSIRTPDFSFGATMSIIACMIDGTPAMTMTLPILKRSEEHTSELQSLTNLVCRLLLVKKTIPTVGDLLARLAGGQLLPYLSVILPIGLFNVVGSLQNIESAEAAGDRFPTAPSLAVNRLGSIAAALFGSWFPTTIYIRHPGWTALGARARYSVPAGL